MIGLRAFRPSQQIDARHPGKYFRIAIVKPRLAGDHGIETLDLSYTERGVQAGQPEIVSQHVVMKTPWMRNLGIGRNMTRQSGDTIITESIAILQYLGTKYGPTPLTPQPEDPNYAAYLQFLVLGEASLAAGLTPLVRAMFMAPDDQKQNWTLKNNAESFIKQLQLVDAQLAKGPYLAGDNFTAADISVGYALAFGEFLSLHDGYSPAVAAYHQRLKDRPAFQKAQTVQ